MLTSRLGPLKWGGGAHRRLVLGADRKSRLGKGGSLKPRINVDLPISACVSSAKIKSACRSAADALARNSRGYREFYGKRG